jgi:hypothetical protein
VKHSPHLVGRQINVGFTIVAQNEAMPVAVTRYGALKLGKQPSALAGTLCGCFDKKSLFVRWLTGENSGEAAGGTGQWHSDRR